MLRSLARTKNMNPDVGTSISCASKQFSFANSVASLNNAANCYAVSARNTQHTCGLLFLVKSMHNDVALHITMSLYSTKYGQYWHQKQSL